MWFSGFTWFFIYFWNLTGLELVIDYFEQFFPQQYGSSFQLTDLSLCFRKALFSFTLEYFFFLLVLFLLYTRNFFSHIYHIYHFLKSLLLFFLTFHFIWLSLDSPLTLIQYTFALIFYFTLMYLYFYFF